MLSVNRQAMRIVEQIIEEQDLLNVGVQQLGNGSTVIDMGIDYAGGWAAAKHLAEATLGGLGRIAFSSFQLSDWDLPQVEVYADNPVIACVISQLSGWPLPELKNKAGIVPLISGPVRALVKKDKFAQIHPYRDCHDTVVAVIQDVQLPDAGVTDYIAREAGIGARNVYALAASTGSLAGSVNVVARTLETAIWRLHEIGFDVNRIVSAWGKAPLPPLTKDEYAAMIRVNTYIYYGGTAAFIVECGDEEIERVLEGAVLSPTSARQYGVPFAKLLDDAGGNILNMTDFVHSVTRVIFYNRATGHVFRHGKNDLRMLETCLSE